MQLKAAFLVLALIFMSIAVLFIRYLQQPAPLPELILPQTEFVYPPHYLYSIYGVKNRLELLFRRMDCEFMLLKALVFDW